MTWYTLLEFDGSLRVKIIRESHENTRKAFFPLYSKM
jgi:hypothetical protein